MKMKRFILYRFVDVSGVSGENEVAEGVQFTDKTVALRWYGEKPSTVIWNSIEDAIAIHGHDGKTRIMWAATD